MNKMDKQLGIVWKHVLLCVSRTCLYSFLQCLSSLKWFCTLVQAYTLVHKVIHLFHVFFCTYSFQATRLQFFFSARNAWVRVYLHGTKCVHSYIWYLRRTLHFILSLERNSFDFYLMPQKWDTVCVQNRIISSFKLSWNTNLRSVFFSSLNQLGLQNISTVKQRI